MTADIREPLERALPSLVEAREKGLTEAETVERVARETLSQVAERMITEAIEALKMSMKSESDQGTE